LKCMVGRTPSCIKTCNSQNTMSAAWRKERSTVETNEIMKTAAHRSESHDADVSFCLFCLMSWCSWCAAALRVCAAKSVTGCLWTGRPVQSLR
jgi:hypothetical protein